MIRIVLAEWSCPSSEQRDLAWDCSSQLQTGKRQRPRLRLRMFSAIVQLSVVVTGNGTGSGTGAVVAHTRAIPLERAAPIMIINNKKSKSTRSPWLGVERRVSLPLSPPLFEFLLTPMLIPMLMLHKNCYLDLANLCELELQWCMAFFKIKSENLKLHDHCAPPPPH